MVNSNPDLIGATEFRGDANDRLIPKIQGAATVEDLGKMQDSIDAMSLSGSSFLTSERKIGLRKAINARVDELRKSK